MVGSFEDAILAVILNVNLESVVIYDGFPFASQHDVPLFKSWLASRIAIDPQTNEGDLGLLLAKSVKQIRPELDVYLLADRKPDEIISDPAAAGSETISSSLRSARK